MNLEKLYNTITSNGCREMDLERFKQAIEEYGIEDNKEEKIRRIGRLDMLQLLFLYLKLTDQIQWSWMLVLLPLLISLWAKLVVKINKHDAKKKRVNNG